ncbi:hypothetical protein [Curtobacterium sp. DN_7.5]|uniref:ORC-CDC6 family AAA ATPase n=1 Tax=Curtobacterium sp. DN_7.5 TaxID=3049047 RepID=UPI001F58AA7D|nr:hypothetical protein [Curtobacterium sp. DN_7.5]
MSAQSAFSSENLAREIGEAFGQVRTEHLRGADVFSMFTTPVYWSQLRGLRPCFLIGGRGTGKTTTLRSLCYEGQAALRSRSIADWGMIGVYWRVDAGVVNTFRGRGLDEDQWEGLFAHYLNLQLVHQLLDFTKWRSIELQAQTAVDVEALGLACVSLGLPEVDNLMALRSAVRLAMARLQGALNGPTAALLQTPQSVAGTPVRYLVEALQYDQVIRECYFAFCIDEYENLSARQQQALNTLIKHSGDGAYTFKIGLRDSVNWSFPTDARGQPLQEPADYTSVRIASNLGDEGFAEFASSICSARLLKISEAAGADLKKLFPDLSVENEARLLGGLRKRDSIRASLEKMGASSSEIAFFDRLPLTQQLLIGYWANSKQVAATSVLREAYASESRWRGRVNNYAYAMLFTIAGRGASRRKYYSGWSILVQMADGNIRYVLQLVGEALTRHVADGNNLEQAVSPATQSDCAALVGERLVRELLGLSERGAQLMRLVLGIGRVFNLMARNPEGHTPEVNQVRLADPDSPDYPAAKLLLEEGVSQGCFAAFAGDKNSRESAAVKSYDYQLHPIFAAFFEYSHRSKRRMNIESRQVLRLATDDVSGAVREITRGRETRGDIGMPLQLELYSDLYE